MALAELIELLSWILVMSLGLSQRYVVTVCLLEGINTHVLIGYSRVIVPRIISEAFQKLFVPWWCYTDK